MYNVWAHFAFADWDLVRVCDRAAVTDRVSVRVTVGDRADVRETVAVRVVLRVAVGDRAPVRAALGDAVGCRDADTRDGDGVGEAAVALAGPVLDDDRDGDDVAPLRVDDGDHEGVAKLVGNDDDAVMLGDAAAVPDSVTVIMVEPGADAVATLLG